MANQLFPISLGVGVGGKDDPFQLPPNKLLQLYNGIFRYTGRIDLRWGYNALGKGIVGSNLTITSGAAINAFEDELILYDNTYAYSYSKTEDAWLNRGIERSVIVSSQLIVANNNQQLSPDLAILNGIEVFVWEDSLGTLRYSVFDSSVGNVILNNSILYTGCPSANVRPKALGFSNMITIFFVNAIGQLLYVEVNPNNPSKVNTYAQILANGLSNPAYYDAAVIAGNLYIAYYTSNSVQLIQLNSLMIIQKQVQVATISSAPTGCINVGSDLSGNVYVSYVDNASNTTVNTAVYNSSLTLLSAPVATITQSTGKIASTASINGIVYGEAEGSVVGGVYNNVLYQNTITTSGTVGTTSVFIRSLGLASKPFYYNGTVYVNVASQSALQPTYFTLDQNANVVAKMLPGLGGGLIQSSDYILPECPQYSTGIFKFPNLQYGVPISEEGIVFGLLGVNCTTLNFFNSNQFLSATMNNSLYTVGGILQQYDGSKYFEAGYHFYPEGTQITTSSSGGNLLGTLDGYTYAWLITYEYTDNNADTLPSTPSISLTATFTSGTTNSATLTIPTLRVTNKQNVKIVVYRTIANGTLFYRDTSALLPLYNDPTKDSVTFTSTQSDTSLQSNALCYTQPDVVGNSVLENTAPPACDFICTYANRIFLAGGEQPNVISYSQQLIPNTPAQFCAQFTINVDPRKGPITGLFVLGLSLVIFTTNSVFYIQGQGPDADGNNSDFQDPIEVITDVGCLTANSITKTTQGLFFQAPNFGIYLLDQGLNVSFKGAPAQYFWSQGSIVSTATTVSPQWAIFQSNTQTTAIVYDYFYDTWKQFTNHQAIDADVYLGNDNLFCYLNSDGTVYQQNNSTYTDNGKFYGLDITTAWVNPGNIQGYMRLGRAAILGNYFSSHNLNVACGFDYENSSFEEYFLAPVDAALGTGPTTNYGTAATYGSDPFYGGAAYGATVYQLRFDIFRKCQSVRFRIWNSEETAVAGQALSLSVLTLELQMKEKLNRIPTIKQFGRL